jgi:ABC-type multidrug transport system ATPase subunit
MQGSTVTSDRSPMLDVRDLTIRVAGRTVVDRVSFDVTAGEVVVVIGPNGAGKTTLLEAVVGARPAPSAIRVRGQLVRSFGERAASFSFAPDDARAPAEVLVSTLVDHAHAHRPRESALLRVLRGDLHIEPILDRSVGTLSRGERKRVLLYLALAADRPVVVLDEPFGAFDPLQLRDVIHSVRALVEARVGILVSIHQLDLAERLADRVLLLADGKRLAFGAVASVLQAAGAARSLEEAFCTLLSGTGENDAS